VSGRVRSGRKSVLRSKSLDVGGHGEIKEKRKGEVKFDKMVGRVWQIRAGRIVAGRLK